MIASYYASYSLEYYEVGEVYSFYARKGDKYAPLADNEIVKRYSKKLDKLEEDFEEYPLYNKFTHLIRLCGVVVGKIQGNGTGIQDKIRVMFKLVDDAGEIIYGEKLYAVNYKGIETDGWEALPVQTYVGACSFFVGTNKVEVVKVQDGKQGRVILDADFSRQGRITLDVKDETGGAKKVFSQNSKQGRVTLDVKDEIDVDKKILSQDGKQGRITLDNDISDECLPKQGRITLDKATDSNLNG